MDGSSLNDVARRFNESSKDVATRLSACNADFGYPSHRLAVYGTLAPGRPNHHIVADIAGTWSDGWVEGTLHELGWGADEGYPAMRWQPGGPRIDVSVLHSAELPDHWLRLDEFEGSEYQRIVVPVFSADAAPQLAFIYASRR